LNFFEKAFLKQKRRRRSVVFSWREEENDPKRDRDFSTRNKQTGCLRCTRNASQQQDSTSNPASRYFISRPAEIESTKWWTKPLKNRKWKAEEEDDKLWRRVEIQEVLLRFVCWFGFWF
jgi:hypothetical protein